MQTVNHPHSVSSGPSETSAPGTETPVDLQLTPAGTAAAACLVVDNTSATDQLVPPSSRKTPRALKALRDHNIKGVKEAGAPSEGGDVC